MFAKKIATTSLDPSCLETSTASRLIPLDKSPGVRPVGIGECLRRLVGKILSKAAAGPIQVCAGHDAGAEAVIHAMQQIWEEESSEGVP